MRRLHRICWFVTVKRKWTFYMSVSENRLLLGSMSWSHTCLHSNKSIGHYQHCESISIFCMKTHRKPKANWLMQKRDFISLCNQKDQRLNGWILVCLHLLGLLSSLLPSFSGFVGVSSAHPWQLWQKENTSSLKAPKIAQPMSLALTVAGLVTYHFPAYACGSWAVMLWLARLGLHGIEVALA